MPSIKDCKTVLVIGATAGIGRALALAIHDLPSKPTIIVAGRRKERLDELVAKGKDNGDRVHAVQFDINTSRDSLRSFVDDVVAKYPSLDAVLFSAGVQHLTDFTEPEKIDLDALTDEFNINYVSVLTLMTFFLPHLIEVASTGQPTFLIPITSVLALLPDARVGCYSATKAALHSLCLTLHRQLKQRNVHVMEIIPPLVESELHDHQGRTPALSKAWMSLEDFVPVVMEGLTRGDVQITAGAGTKFHERFEAEKVDLHNLADFKP